MSETRQTVDARCNHGTCTNRDIYRMVGSCSNCRTENILVLFTATHDSHVVECPTCGCRKVYVTRLATGEDIPAGITPMSERDRFDAACREHWAKDPDRTTNRAAQAAIEIFMQEWQLTWGERLGGFDPDHPKQLARWLRECGVLRDA